MRWKQPRTTEPFYYLLEDAGFEVMLVNARHVKNLPGRKSDVSDATWLAQLGADGLVRGSFVPPEPIRHLRDLTRARTAITRERGREVQRLEVVIEPFQGFRYLICIIPGIGHLTADVVVATSVTATGTMSSWVSLGA